MKEVTVSGKIFGIPEFYNTRNILVNGSALTQAGLSLSDVSTTDWNKLHTTAQRLYQSKGSHVSRIGFDPKLPEFLPLWAQGQRCRPGQPRRVAQPGRRQDRGGRHLRHEPDR